MYTCKLYFIKGINLSNDLTPFAHRLVEGKKMLVAKAVYPKNQKGQSTQENNIIKIIFTFKTDSLQTANSYLVGKKTSKIHNLK